MTATACILAALLSFETASAPATKGACDLTNDRCKAALYERRSVTATTADHRAQYLFNAHNLYLRLFDKTGDARDLCAARRAIEASLAVDDQPATLRSESQALRTKLLARAKQQGARCARKTKRPAEHVPADAPLVARATEPTGPTSVTMGTSPEAPTTPTAAASELLLVDADPAPLRDDGLMPVEPRQAPSARPRPSVPHPGRGLVIAGGVTLGVGVALTAVAGLMGHRTIEARREANTLHDTYGLYPPPSIAAQGDALVRDFNVMKSQTVALALLGGATVVVAAVLATLGGRRMARATRRTALVPGPGGLLFHGRF
jgi:hypothetical protein